mmetsp:Transcript_23419/g.65780  ORF Transcript_23419/g.65780 Transcript_23419/m.65780 type:complete len:245 (-) Transcript_23419:971-1705(-)
MYRLRENDSSVATSARIPPPLPRAVPLSASPAPKLKLRISSMLIACDPTRFPRFLPAAWPVVPEVRRGLSIPEDPELERTAAGWPFLEVTRSNRFIFMVARFLKAGLLVELVPPLCPKLPSTLSGFPDQAAKASSTSCLDLNFSSLTLYLSGKLESSKPEKEKKSKSFFNAARMPFSSSVESQKQEPSSFIVSSNHTFIFCTTSWRYGISSGRRSSFIFSCRASFNLFFRTRAAASIKTSFRST